MLEARYIFGVVEVGLQQRFSCRGFGGEQVQLVGNGTLKAVAQPCQPNFLAGASMQTQTEAALVHHSVLQNLLHHARAIAPARFGTLVAGDDAGTAEWLSRTQASLFPILQRIRGRWEMAVKVETLRRHLAHATSGSGHPSDGRAYLMQRLEAEREEAQQERETHELESELLKELRPYLVEYRVEPRREGEGAVTLSCLIRREDHLPFTNRLHGAVAKRGLLVTQCQALPPYSFVQQAF